MKDARNYSFLGPTVTCKSQNLSKINKNLKYALCVEIQEKLLIPILHVFYTKWENQTLGTLWFRSNTQVSTFSC